MDDVRQDDLSTEDGALLRELQKLWGGYYQIRVDDDGWWRAERNSTVYPGSVSAPKGALFRQLLVQDAIHWRYKTPSQNASLARNPAPRSASG